MDATQLIMLMGGGVGSLVIGFITKKYTTVPNGLIPLINGTVFSLLFATLGGMGFTYQALITGMSAAYAATAAYELKNVKPAEAPK